MNLRVLRTRTQARQLLLVIRSARDEQDVALVKFIL